ncbi:anti-anti-sigma factor, partial [Planococcus sp. SIMBA_143]
MKVVSSSNNDHYIIPEGYPVAYASTYSHLIIQSDQEAMRTKNLGSFTLTKDLEVTTLLEVKGFLGVTLRAFYGEVLGTL